MIFIMVDVLTAISNGVSCFLLYKFRFIPGIERSLLTIGRFLFSTAMHKTVPFSKTLLTKDGLLLYFRIKLTRSMHFQRIHLLSINI